MQKTCNITFSNVANSKGSKGKFIKGLGVMQKGSSDKGKNMDLSSSNVERVVEEGCTEERVMEKNAINNI